MRFAMLSGATLTLVLGCAAAFGGLTRSPPANITAAVADPARPDADRARDADRKPAETLAFAGVKTGDIVVELAPGHGYYTRLLSAAVGPKGKVYAVMSPPKPDAPPNAPVPGAEVRAIAADASSVRVPRNEGMTAPRPSRMTRVRYESGRVACQVVFVKSGTSGMSQTPRPSTPWHRTQYRLKRLMTTRRSCSGLRIQYHTPPVSASEMSPGPGV